MIEKGYDLSKGYRVRVPMSKCKWRDPFVDVEDFYVDSENEDEDERGLWYSSSRDLGWMVEIEPYFKGQQFRKYLMQRIDELWTGHEDLNYVKRKSVY